MDSKNGPHNEHATIQIVPTSIMDLNDTCLRRIFANLNLFELSAAADVCTHFKRNAQKHFATSKYKYLDLYNEMPGVADVLRNFGPLIVFIKVTFIKGEPLLSSNTEIIKLIRKYCDGHLNALVLDNFDVTDRLLAMLIPNVRGRFNQPTSLKTSWETKSLVVSGHAWKFSEAEAVFSENPQLRQTGLADFSQELQFVDGISNLKYVKSLKLIKISGMSASHLIDISKNLRNLTELVLVDTIALSSENLLELIVNTGNLETIFMDHNNRSLTYDSIDEDSYNKMASSIEKRGKRIHLNMVSKECHRITLLLTISDVATIPTFNKPKSKNLNGSYLKIATICLCFIVLAWCNPYIAALTAIVLISYSFLLAPVLAVGVSTWIYNAVIFVVYLSLCRSRRIVTKICSKLFNNGSQG